jgi:hypothetical protein
LGISERIDSVPGDVNLEGSGGSLRDDATCREVSCGRRGRNGYTTRRRSVSWECYEAQLGEQDSKVGARLSWMVVSTKERGVRRMQITHWKRAPNGRVTVLPTKLPFFILRFHLRQ